MLYVLNDTAIVVLQQEDTQLSAPTAVQVTIKSTGPVTTGDLVAFFQVQREVSDIVTRIITAHLQNPFPSPMHFDGHSYALTAKHTVWRFGREGVEFSWGTQDILPGRDKWTFFFASLKQE